MASNHSLSPAEDMLAAEYVLRLADDAQMAQAEHKLASENGFATAVDDWRFRLDALFDSIPEVEPPHHIWPQILHGIGAETPLPATKAANDNAGFGTRFWRRSALAASAVAAALALTLLWPSQDSQPIAPDLPTERAVAQLSGETPGLLFTASYDSATSQLRIRSSGTQTTDMADASLAPELWVIPSDGTPRSLGLIAEDGVSEITVPEGHRAFMESDSILAITSEAIDGAPHAAPSAAPIASGQLQRI